MDSQEKSTAKRLMALFSEANRDYEPISDREQKTKLRMEIERKRAHRDELKQMVSALTVLSNGLQAGAESANTQRAIVRETHEIVRSIKEKKMRNQQPACPNGAPDKTSKAQEKMMEERLHDSIRYQERALATLRRSRVFVMLEQAKEDARKTQQALDGTQSVIQQTVEAAKKEEDEMLQAFVGLAIQIGEEQERLEQKQAQVDGSSQRRREALQERMDCDSAGSVARRVEIADEQIAPVPCANDEQREDEDENREGPMGLNFSNIIEEFPIGSMFKNPNNFPEILSHIKTPKDYKTLAKEVVKSPNKNGKNPNRKGKENISKPMQKGSSVVVAIRKELTGRLPSPSKTRKAKQNVSGQPQQGAAESDRGIGLNEQQKDAGKNGARNSKTNCVEKSRGKTTETAESHRKGEFVSPVTPPKPSEGAEPGESLMVIKAAEPKGKPTAATETLATKRAPLGQTDPADGSPNIFKPPSAVNIVKPSTKQQPKDARGKQPTAQKQQAKKPAANEAPRKQLPKRTCSRVPEKPTLPIRKRPYNVPPSPGQEPTSDGEPDDAMEIDNPTSPARSTSSHGSLFDLNVLSDFQEGNIDTDDLDFLMNDSPVVGSSQAKKAKKSNNEQEADSFTFDFDAQDSNDNMDQGGNDIF